MLPQSPGFAPRPSAFRAGVLVMGIVLTVAFGLSGCTSSSSNANGSGSTVAATPLSSPTAATTPTTSPAASTPTRTTSPATTMERTTTSATTTPVTITPATTESRPSTGSTTAAPTHEPRCATAALTFGAQRGSGAMQQQYATISVTNHGVTSCWLIGYAQVVLVAGGAPLGRPAAPAGPTVSAVFLTAGHGGTASLHGPSTCNAGVSDSVRISAPGGTTHTDVALPMRACALTIAAFRAF